jgi:hypothetical protein
MAAMALLAALLVFGLEPAVQLTRTADVRGELASGSAIGLPRARRHRLLLRWQVAVATAYFIVAAMTIRYVFAERAHDSGVRLDGLVVALLHYPDEGRDDGRARSIVDRVLDETRGHPEIAAAAVTAGLPFGIAAPPVQVSTPERVLQPDAARVSGTLVAATPDVFRALGISIVRGRGFDVRDDAAAPAVVVVSESTARRVFGTIDVIGQTIVLVDPRIGGQRSMDSAAIAGVASDTDTAYMREKRDAVVYAPLAQRSYGDATTFIARSRGRDGAALQAMQAVLRRVDADVAIQLSGPAGDVLTDAYPLVRYISQAAVFLGMVTLALAMAGLYGIQSHGVTRRTREIGVRMSFGATVAQIRRMVLKEGYRPVAEGLAIGLFMGLSGRAIIRLYLDAPIAILDPWTIAIAPLPLVLAAFCACILPAHRAARINPTVALRHL